MSPHKQAWQHFSSPRGMKFPQGRYRGYPQCLPRGHPVSGGTSPGHRRARSPLPSLGPRNSPLKHSSRSLVRATVGSPSTSWKSAILRGAKPRASSGLVWGTRDPPEPATPQSPRFSRAPTPPSAAPAGWGGETSQFLHRPQHQPALVQPRHGGPSAPSPRAA